MHKFNQQQSSDKYSVMEPLIFAVDQRATIVVSLRETERKWPTSRPRSPGELAGAVISLGVFGVVSPKFRNNAFTFDLRKPRFATIDANVYDSQFGISRMNKLQPSRVS